MPSTTMPVVLVVEDEPQICRFLRAALEAEGWRVHEAQTLQRALIDAASRKPDLIILDLGLPDGDGLDFIVSFRRWSLVPIIVLSARAGEASKIQALDTGADDYLTKPFSVGELLARVRSTVRRRNQAGVDPTGVVQFGEVRIDQQARLVTKSGVVVHLTPIEYRLMAVLAANAGRVVTSLQLLREVWGPKNEDNSHYLRVYMGHLRLKLEDDPAQPLYLVTESGIGYRLLLPLAP